MAKYAWKTERIRPEDGRVMCCIPRRGNVYRSRLVYCNHHGLSLEDISGLHVHHIDGDASNDVPENLELLTSSAHYRKHPDNARGKRSRAACGRFSEAQKQAWREGKYKNRKPRREAYSEEISSEVVRGTSAGESQVSIAQRLKIPRTSVQGMIYRRRKNGSLV